MAVMNQWYIRCESQMTVLRKAETSAAEEKLTRAIQQVRDRYEGGVGAFIRDYRDSVSTNSDQRELPLESIRPSDRERE